MNVTDDLLAELAETARLNRTRAKMHLRLVQGEAALFTLREAARLLPMAEREAREFIEANVKPVWFAGRPRYRWGDVLAAGTRDDEPEAAPPVAIAVGETIGRRKVKPR